MSALVAQRKGSVNAGRAGSSFGSGVKSTAPDYRPPGAATRQRQAPVAEVSGRVPFIAQVASHPSRATTA